MNGGKGLLPMQRFLHSAAMDVRDRAVEVRCQNAVGCRARRPGNSQAGTPALLCQFHCHPFAGGLDLKLAFPGGDELAGVGQHL